MDVADVMTPRESLITVDLPGTREDVLEHFQTDAFSSVPVVKHTDDGEEFRGLVSREALIENPDEDQLALLVEEVPSTTAGASLQDLASLMLAEEARRVPVVDGRLEGIVTITDVVRAIATGDADAQVEVESLATSQVNSVHTETPLLVAGSELSLAEVAYAVVLDEEGEPTGMLTEVDILDVARVVEGEAETGESIANEDDEWMWEGIKAVGNRYFPTRNVEIPSDPVREFMSSDLITISRRQTAQDVAQVMISEDIEQVPMMSGDDLVGIILDMDLLEALT